MQAENRSQRPRIGVFADLTDETAPLLDFARAVEERGLGGLFLNEHTHLPVDHSTSAFPGGGPTPRRYGHFWDPYIALAFVAAQTGLEVGTAVSLIAEHDPIQLGHAIATLDYLSGGRFVLGVGYGWNREEYADHRGDPAQRAEVVIETLALMRSMWTDEVSSFQGRYMRLSPSHAYPKPVQRPHPPVFFGGRPGERNFERAARCADGWITMGQAPGSKDFAGHVAMLDEAWRAAGRTDRPQIAVIYNPGRARVTWPEMQERCAELNIERLLYHVSEGDLDAMVGELDVVAAGLVSA